MASQKWNLETDVIVVGFGGAGATAAITAHDSGAEVILLEKMPVGGGNTATAGGHFLCPDSAGDFEAYYGELSHGHRIGAEVVHAVAEKMAENAAWFEQVGDPDVEVVRVAVPGHGRMSEFQTFTGAENVHCCTLKFKGERGRGEELFGVLENAVRERDIEILFESPVTGLVTGINGEINGVEASSDNRTVPIKARRAVILACGGFENDREMVADFLGYNWTKLRYSGTPGNTGDGIRMAQRAGAALWHMNNASGPFLGFVPPGYITAIHGHPLVGWGFICVNRYGMRFGTESRDAVAHVPSYIGEYRESMHGKGMEHIFFCDYMHTGRIDYPNIPCYAIFDETTRKQTKHRGRGRIVYSGHLSPPGIYRWSDGLADEIDKGWVVRGDGLKMLAEAIGIDVEGLEKTVDKYNRYCDDGKDDEYHRSGDTLVSLREPPFYAMKLMPTILNTQGGPKRDRYCRIINPDDKPIPRLYSAGEMGSIFGFLYNAGGNIGECFATGRIAGENAANEKPWD